MAALIVAIKSLGGTPTQPCTYTFRVSGINDFLTTAQALEITGVSAYDGALSLMFNASLIQTGATIATVRGASCVIPEPDCGWWVDQRQICSSSHHTDDSEYLRLPSRARLIRR